MALSTRLAGKVALISGGGTGIGAATARLFAAEGAKVVVTGRRPEPIAAVAAEVAGVAVSGDTSDPAHAAEAVAAAVTTFGGLDVVVANAGIGFGGSAGDVTDEHWQRTLDVNLTGPMVLTRAALPAMLERGGGSIVLVSSINGLVATTDSAAYGTSKAGLIGLAAPSRSITALGGSARTRCVRAGWSRPMADEEMDELGAAHGIGRQEAYDLATTDVPLRRAATAGEIASCCLFLASDESSIVTGAVLVADGGGLAVALDSTAFGPSAGPAG